MNVVNAAVFTAGIVTAGEWADGRKLSPRFLIGGTFLAVALAGISEISEEVASAFASLILLVVCFRYVPALAFKFGLIDKKPAVWG